MKRENREDSHQEDQEDKEIKIKILPETEPKTTTGRGFDSFWNSNGNSGGNREPITISNNDRFIGIQRKGVLLKFEDNTKITTGAKMLAAVGGGKSSKLTHIEGKLMITRKDKLNQGRVAENGDFQVLNLVKYLLSVCLPIAFMTASVTFSVNTT